MPAVADLDNDGYKEFIWGDQSGIYVWRSNGTHYSQNPLYQYSGYNLSSSPVICYFDGDGDKEIFVS